MNESSNDRFEEVQLIQGFGLGYIGMEKQNFMQSTPTQLGQGFDDDQNLSHNDS